MEFIILSQVQDFTIIFVKTYAILAGLSSSLLRSLWVVTLLSNLVYFSSQFYIIHELGECVYNPDIQIGHKDI